MDKNKLITHAAMEVLWSQPLSDQYPGFKAIIEGLVESGEVMFPIHAPTLEQHLLSFPFIQSQGLVPDMTDIIKFSFDREMFQKDPLFQDHAVKKAKELNQESKSLMDEAFNKQKLAGEKHDEACALLVVSGLAEEDELIISTAAPDGLARKRLEEVSKQESRTVHRIFDDNRRHQKGGSISGGVLFL